MKDIEIAQAAKLLPIQGIADKAGIVPENVYHYGKYIAKVDAIAYKEKPTRAKLVLVTAINPTPAGEGKTTVSIGLADGMTKLGKQAMLALREPSLGPVFGVKGGATGGGYTQVLPMENINLHFTGDLHAITTANNLLASMIDNHMQQGNELNIDPRQILFRRCVDLNDRQLRSVIDGLGGSKNGVPREDGFDITAASEIMAVFCMADGINDLKKRLANIVVAKNYAGENITCGQLGAQGAMAALLRDALMPNLVQTIDGTPCLIHGGPFANIAHGCNSITATKTAMRLADYVVTEAGFGADLGAEKFLDIKCRAAGIWPSTIVLVATIRALKHHGGVPKVDLGKENVEALLLGAENLKRHIQNITEVWKLPVVVAINKFALDTEAEVTALFGFVKKLGVACELSDGWAHGGEGTKELAQTVMRTIAENKNDQPHYTYELSEELPAKIEAIAKKVYGASTVAFSGKTKAILAELAASGFGRLPVCIAKTQYSLSDNAKLINAPKDFELTIRDVRLSAGAGFVVAFAGDIIAMPGLPKHPAALDIDVDENGKISGLF